MTQKPTESAQAEQEQLNTQEPVQETLMPQKAKSSVLIWVVLGILIVLLVLSAVLLTVRLTEYAKADDRTVLLDSNIDESFDVFAIEYKNDSGEVTIQGADGQKVLAPGSAVDYTIRLRNTDRVAIDYVLSPKVQFLSDIVLPIEVRLIGAGEEYIVGSATEWVPMEQLAQVQLHQTLMAGQSMEYYFQWRWRFESGDDAYDTWLGSNAVDMEVGAQMAFSIQASANMQADLNGGWFGYQTTDVLYIILFILLLIAAITLVIIMIVRKYGSAPALPTEPAPIPGLEPEPEPVPAYLFDPNALMIGMTDHMNVIRLEEIAPHFEAGEVVNLAILQQKELMHPKATTLKVLSYANCDLQKPLIIEAHRVSAEARKVILAAGGTVRIIKK